MIQNHPPSHWVWCMYSYNEVYPRMLWMSIQQPHPRMIPHNGIVRTINTESTRPYYDSYESYVFYCSINYIHPIHHHCRHVLVAKVQQLVLAIVAKVIIVIACYWNYSHVIVCNHWWQWQSTGHHPY